MASCIKCGAELNDSNWYISCQRQHGPNYTCKKCFVEQRNIWKRTNQKYYNEYTRNYAQNLRYTAIRHYSHTMSCAKCGEKDLRCLSIDHINGGGNKHLKEIGVPIAQWLRKNNYPNGFQVLCMNCQWRKRHENHECSAIKL